MEDPDDYADSEESVSEVGTEIWGHIVSVLRQVILNWIQSNE